MSKIALPDIKTLFADTGPQREPVSFSWRLVCRQKLPFLLLPENLGRSSFGMQLYPAQRPLGRMCRTVVPFMMPTPMAKIFRRVTLQADASSGLMQFLAQQSGLPAGQLQAPAIKFGHFMGRTSRLVMLLCDAGSHPVRIIKVGLNPQGRTIIDREADLLSRLPVNVIGCVNVTGRFSSATLSAFATSYFPGVSLDDDVGIEKLFHDWLNNTPPEPIRNLSSWRELESAANAASLPQWPKLCDVLAEQTVRSTIFHGDFTPWNVRMINLENIRAFDWESGHLNGIPAWDWFHFIVQTSILVKRYSPERVAAELEHMIHSPRFQKYADAAGISQIIEPLLLAYLLRQKIIIQPREGLQLTNRLFQLLWAGWQMKVNVGKPAALPAADLQLPAVKQIKFAFAKLANIFWEPSLSPDIHPPLSAQLSRYWLALVAAFLWIGVVATFHFFRDPHLLFTPFYLIPCVVLALKADRRLALIVACVAGFTGPLLHYFKEPLLVPINATCWNMVMRAIVFQLIVILLDRLRKRSLYQRPYHTTAEQDSIQAISGNWAVVLVTSIYFVLVVLLDVLTNPYLIFLPLYLLPCVIFTLALDWRWGTLAAVVAAIVGPLAQRFEGHGYQLFGVEFWNTFMRLVIFQTVVLLVDSFRRGNVLFRQRQNELNS